MKGNTIIFNPIIMNLDTIIGISASILTGISMLPQLIKLIKERKANDISLVMLITLISGLIIWVWYGIKKGDWIIIISNGFSVLINILILILSLIYKNPCEK
jgi:MtN3 and saliva related transmembrane protein